MTKTKRVIALGFFDGVHLGHGALLQSVKEAADRLGLVPAAFTFDKSPTAAITGQRPGTVRSHLSRARGRLREWLADV